MNLTTPQIKEFLKKEIKEQFDANQKKMFRQRFQQQYSRAPTEAEMIRMYKAFTELDSSGDGVIDSEELKAGEKKMPKQKNSPQRQFNPNKPPRHISKSPLIQLLVKQDSHTQSVMLNAATRWKREHNMNHDQLAAALMKTFGSDLAVKSMKKPEEASSITHAIARELNPFGD